MVTKKTAAKSVKPKAKGAQPGNANATTHNIYAKHYSDDEMTRIISALTDPTTPISAAIEATAVMLDRIIKRITADDSPDAKHADFLELAHLHNETTGRLASLARNRAILSGDTADTITGHIGALLDALATELSTPL